uniref:Chromosome 15 open reading frame 62 n=1 Tax=Ornithorhynchus anatinus TaxID=9258 RepID=A0A6I8NLJ0_ORNAN
SSLRPRCGAMEPWRRGSLRSATLWKRLSLGRAPGRDGGPLGRAGEPGGHHQEYSDREVTRELRGRGPDGRRLPLRPDGEPAPLPPPKPPRLYRDSCSCPNILDPPPAFDATLPNARSLAGPLRRRDDDDDDDEDDDEEKPTDARPRHRPPDPHPSPADLDDPLLSFRLDLGLPLLEEVLQTLRERFPREHGG